MDFLFITLEGLDCAGKSSLAARLAERLNAHIVRFPNRASKTGRLLDEFLRGPPSLLKTEDLKETNLKEEIPAIPSDKRSSSPAQSENPTEKQEKTINNQVVHDAHVLHLLFSANRFEQASAIKEKLKTQHVIADRYSASGIAYSVAKGLDIEWCRSTESALPMPDLTFFIDAQPEDVATRPGFGREAHDCVPFQRKVYAAYKQQAGMVWVDGRQSLEGVEAAIWRVIEDRLNNKRA